MAQRRRFTGGADRHQAVDPLVDLPFDKALETLLVDRAVLEGRDQCGIRPLELDHLALTFHRTVTPRTDGDNCHARPALSSRC
jgi:hypothetical protein